MAFRLAKQVARSCTLATLKIVDFILNSADEALKEHFGKGITGPVSRSPSTATALRIAGTGDEGLGAGAVEVGSTHAPVPLVQ